MPWMVAERSISELRDQNFVMHQIVHSERVMIFDADQFDETKFVFENAVGSLCTCEGAVKTHA